MESDKKVLYVDDREPNKLVEKLEDWKEKEGFEVDIMTTRLEHFDVLYVHGDIRIGWELKRIITGDQRNSNIEGRTKQQIKNHLKACKHQKYYWVVGDPKNMKYTDRKAMCTLKTEINLLGISTDTIRGDHWVALRIIRTCQFIEGDKIIVFKAYCNPVIRDDSILTKMMKQSPRFGDKTASYFGSSFRNFLEILLTPQQIKELLLRIDIDKLYRKVSNFVRESGGKKHQKASLQNVIKFVNWFFGIDKASPNVTPAATTAQKSNGDTLEKRESPNIGVGRGVDGKEVDVKIVEVIDREIPEKRPPFDDVIEEFYPKDKDSDSEFENWLNEDDDVDSTLDKKVINEEKKEISDWGVTI